MRDARWQSGDGLLGPEAGPHRYPLVDADAQGARRRLDILTEVRMVIAAFLTGTSTSTGARRGPGSWRLLDGDIA
jgi:hypothetical protein